MEREAIVKIPSQCDHDIKLYRFARSAEVNAPIEDWSPSDRAADRVVGIVAALCAIGLILL